MVFAGVLVDGGGEREEGSWVDDGGVSMCDSFAPCMTMISPRLSRPYDDKEQEDVCKRLYSSLVLLGGKSLKSQRERDTNVQNNSLSSNSETYGRKSSFIAVAHIATLHLHPARAFPLHVIEKSRMMPEHPSRKE